MPPPSALKCTRLPIRPTVDEFMKEINHQIDFVQEIVIAGEGEPTLVMDKLIKLLQAIRTSSAKIPIRINTNGIVEDSEPIIRCAKDLSIGFSVAVMTDDANVHSQLMDVDPGRHTLMQNFVRKAISAALDIEASAIERPEVNKDSTQHWVTHDLHVKNLRWRSYFP